MTMWAAVYSAGHTVLVWGHSGGLWLGSLTIERAEAVRRCWSTLDTHSAQSEIFLTISCWARHGKETERQRQGGKESERQRERERDREGNKIATTRYATLADKAKAKRQTCSNNKNNEEEEGEEGDCKEEKHDRDYEELQDKQARRQYKHTHKHTN